MIAVSVVIPAYQAARDLAKNLPPLLASAPPGTEVLVVDDGSSDGTAETARALGARVLVQENRGPAAARNHGAREASGAVLVFLDADCRPTPGWLPALLAPLQDPEVVAVKGAYLSQQPEWVARLSQLEFEERYDMLRRQRRIDFVDSFSMAIRRDLFLAIGAFDESFVRADNEDVDLSFRIASRGHAIAFAEEARVLHRHPDSLRRYFRLKLSRGYYRARVYERYPGKALRDSYTPLSLKLQVVAIPAMTVLAGIALLLPSAVTRLGSLATVALLAASMIPFTVRVARSHPRLALGAPVFLLARATAIGAGVVLRALRLPGPRPKITRAIAR